MMQNVKSFLLCLLFLFLPDSAWPEHAVTINVEWEYTQPPGKTLQGFNLYRGSDIVCTSHGTTTQMSCQAIVFPGIVSYTMTALFMDGTESAHSMPYYLMFPEDPSAGIYLSLSSPVGAAPHKVTFSVTGPEVSSTQYKWSFGDGLDGNGRDVSHIYTTPGTYTITLLVSDPGKTDYSMTTTITVTSDGKTNPPPQAVILPETVTGKAFSDVSFDGSTSFSPDGKIAQWRWSLGDGTIQYGPRITHRYAIAGHYNAVLQVIDKQGFSAQAAKAVRIDPPAEKESSGPPEAVISTSRTSGKAPLRVDFSGTLSTSPSGAIESFSWHFGDGRVQVGPNATHTFEIRGDYRVVLEIIDNAGQVGRATAMIRAGDLQPNLIPVLLLLLLSED